MTDPIDRNHARAYMRQFGEPATVFINLLRKGIGLDPLPNIENEESHSIDEWAHHFAGDGNRQTSPLNSDTGRETAETEFELFTASRNALSMREMKSRQRRAKSLTED